MKINHSCRNRVLFPAILFFLLFWDVNVSATPLIKVVPENYNFGVVVRGEIVAKEFVIENHGSSRLDISRVKTSCGCSAVFLEGETVLPGSSTLLDVEFDSSDFLGKVRKTVFIYSNDPKNPEYSLTFTAIVQSIVETKPDRLYLGTLRSIGENGKDFPFKVSFLYDNAKISDLEVNRRFFNVFCETRQQQNDAYVYNCRLTVKPDIPIGSIMEELIIHTNMPEQPRFKMKIFGIFKGAFKVFPMLVDYGELSSHNRAQKTVTIRRTDGKPFNILKVVTDREEITCKVIPKHENQAYQMILHFAPGGLSDVVEGRVVVLTDHDRHSEIQIKYQAFVE